GEGGQSHQAVGDTNAFQESRATARRGLGRNEASGRKLFSADGCLKLLVDPSPETRKLVSDPPEGG
ncbi:MAG: hypothetical protein MI861_01485, partial [Pirellulales bacterium]|nr:hypothetical protein [Pirellulales bacterium]